MTNNSKNKKTIIDPYFLLSLYNGTYQNGGTINSKSKVLNTISNYNTEIPNEKVLAAYGKMIKKKYAYGGAGGEDPNTMKGINWNSFLDARDEDLLNNFAEDPNNPHNQTNEPTDEEKQSVDWMSLGTTAAGLGVSAINAFGNDEEDRITGKGVRQQAAKSALTMGATGAKIGSMFGPIGTAIGAGIGAIGGATVGTIQAKKAQEEQADYLKDLYYGALGGKLPNSENNNEPTTEKRKQTAFTLRPNKYGSQNYFEWAENNNPKTTTTLVDIHGNTYESDGSTITTQSEKIGLFDSIEMARRINKNTRNSGRDVGRVKLNAFVDRTLDPIPAFAMGGDITEINGPRHDQGGVQLTPNAEVEGGEVKVDNYIFSDRLTPNGSNQTFADLAKKIKKKYEERPDDGPSLRAQESQLKELMMANEDARIKQEAKDKQIEEALQSDVMAYGGCIRKSNGGNIEIDPSRRGTFTKAAKARGMGVQEFAQKILSHKENYSSSMIKKANFAHNAAQWRANGGPLNDGVDPTTDPNAPIEVYPGHPQYGDYTAWKTQNEKYNTFNTEQERLKTTYGEGTSYKANQFNSIPGMEEFSLPQGATGVTRYKTNELYKPGQGIGSDYYTSTDGSYVYVPTYAKPEGNYVEVKDPKVVEQERINAEYAEKNKDIQGWKRNVYSEQQEDGTWINKTELIPIPNGQDVPTDGSFVPKGNVPPAEYTPKLKYGGNIKYPNGGPLQLIPEANYDDFQLDYNDPFFNPYGATTGKDGITRTYPSKEAYREAYLKNQPYGLLKMPTISRINNVPNIETNFNDFANKNLSSITSNSDDEQTRNVITPYSPEYLDDPNTVLPLRKIPEANFDDFTLDYPNPGSGQTGSAKAASPKNKQPLKIGNEEMSLLLSNLPALDNIMSSFNVEKSKLERVKPEELSLEKQRQLTERQATIGRNITRENIRANAGSSGASLSTMAAANSAITESVIQSHLQSLMAEETANNQIRNQANATNTQITNQEILANEQNRAMAKSMLNLGLSDISTNTQGYLKDKKMNAENIRQNKRLMSIINSFAPNYKWEDDNGEFAIQFITAANMSNNQLPPME